MNETGAPRHKHREICEAYCDGMDSDASSKSVFESPSHRGKVKKLLNGLDALLCNSHPVLALFK
jgi:hypothetical protein